jgi:CBS domain-containing protein
MGDAPMFSIYGVSGRVFNGTLEQLRQVVPVRAPERAGALQPSGRDPRATGFGEPDFAETTSGHQRSAIAAYTQTQRGPYERHTVRHVDELMTRRVITVQQDMPVAQAWQLIAQRRIGQLPVLDGMGMLVGMLLRADLLRPELLGVGETLALAERLVGDVMWSPVPGVSPDTDIRRVAQVLLDTQLPGLPVADDQGQVVGFISRSDILRAVVADPPLDLWT